MKIEINDFFIRRDQPNIINKLTNIDNTGKKTCSDKSLELWKEYVNKNPEIYKKVSGIWKEIIGSKLRMKESIR